MLPISPYEFEANQIANRGIETGRKLWHAIRLNDVRDPLDMFNTLVKIIADTVETDQTAHQLFVSAAIHGIPSRDLERKTFALFEHEFTYSYKQFVKTKENVES